MNFNGRKLLLLGFIIVLLVGIPATLFLVQQQQETRSRAEKSTTLSITPESTSKEVGQAVPLDIMVNPGTNLVSFVKLEITYDETKLSINESTGFVPNAGAFPITVEGPAFTPGKILVSLSIGANTTAAISNITKVGTLNFTTLETTSGGTTTVGLGPQTQVLSAGANDQASEDTLSTTVPARVTIGGSPVITPSTTVTPSFTPTPTVTTAPNSPTATPTTPPTLTPTPTLIPTPTSTQSASTPNQPPVCSALNLDRGTTGTAPYSLTFTALGNDTDGTITQASFNFGDGPVTNVSTGGGIGSKSINTQIAHTYNNAGTYTAYAILTDNSGAVSNFNTCKTTITVNSGTGGSGSTSGGSSTGSTATTAPTIAPTGPSTVLVSAGAVLGALSLIGAFVFFLL